MNKPSHINLPKGSNLSLIKCLSPDIGNRGQNNLLNYTLGLKSAKSRVCELYNPIIQVLEWINYKENE